MPKAKGVVPAERAKLLFSFSVSCTESKNEKRITALASKSRDDRN